MKHRLLHLCSLGLMAACQPQVDSDYVGTGRVTLAGAVQKGPFVNMEWALMADGVAPADVYKVLGTDAGVERALKKLDTIKKDVVWWESGAEGPQLLADGQTAAVGRPSETTRQTRRP